MNRISNYQIKLIGYCSLGEELILERFIQKGPSSLTSLCGEFVIVGTVEFSSEITIPLSFTAECAENAEALENPSVDWNTLKLCALCDLRVDKSLVF